MTKRERSLFEEAVEIALDGDPESIRAVLASVAEETAICGRRPFWLEDVQHRSYGRCLSVRASAAQGEGPIGLIVLVSLPPGRTLLRVPPGRGSTRAAEAFSVDTVGELFIEFLKRSAGAPARLGFLPVEKQKPPLGFLQR
ncbi:MAG: hypothetical protein ACUVV3_02110 [Dehalococcoidia bacterium]